MTRLEPQWDSIKQQYFTIRKDGSRAIFCWWCGRKLWNRHKPIIVKIDGLPRTMHKCCAEHTDIFLAQGKEEA